MCAWHSGNAKAAAYRIAIGRGDAASLAHRQGSPGKCWRCVPGFSDGERTLLTDSDRFIIETENERMPARPCESSVVRIITSARETEHPESPGDSDVGRVSRHGGPVRSGVRR